ncbi:MAG: hypothetical protein ABWY50_02515 [Aeromicrobium sp.]
MSGLLRRTLPGLRGPALPLVIGLQAVAAVLYCLALTGRLLPVEDLDLVRPFDGLVRSGNLAQTMLLTTLGFALTRLLLEARRRSPVVCLAVGVMWLAGLLLVLALVCCLAWLFGRVQDPPVASAEVTRTSIQQILTFRWNYWVAEHPLGSRADLVSLWFLVVAAQLVAGLVVLVLVLGRLERVLAVTVALLAVAALVWREVAFDEYGWFQASLDTLARSDAFLIGVLAALMSPRLRFTPNLAAAIASGSFLVLLGLVLASSFTTVEGSFNLWPVAALLAGMVCLGAAHAPQRASLVVETLGSSRLGRAGGLWLPAVAWAGYVVSTASRTEDVDPYLVSAVCLLVTAFAAVLSGMLLERVIARMEGMLSPSSAEDGPEDRGAGGEPAAHA